MKVTITHRHADNTVDKLEGLNGEPLARYKAQQISDDELAALGAKMLAKEPQEYVDEHGQIYDKRAIDAHTPIVKYSEAPVTTNDDQGYPYVWEQKS